ncbi:MAG: hypothetical protein AAF249_03025 [Pseudomonadota bacterium]
MKKARAEIDYAVQLPGKYVKVMEGLRRQGSPKLRRRPYLFGKCHQFIGLQISNFGSLFHLGEGQGSVSKGGGPRRPLGV